MTPEKSIKRIASFFRISSDLESLQRRVELDPNDLFVLKLYIREMLRKGNEISDDILDKYASLSADINESMLINNEKMMQAYLQKRYGRSGHLSEDRWTFRQMGITDLKWLEGVSSSSLKVLNITNNLLTNLEGISKLDAPGLKTLVLSNNKLQTLEQLSDGLFPVLNNLHLANNPLKSLRGLERLRLKQLTLNNNSRLPLSSLDSLHTQSIKDLDLSNMGISSFDTMDGLNFTSLLELDLSGNYISSFRELIHLNAPKLESIILLNNNIRTLDGIDQFLEGKPKELTIHLGYNPVAVYLREDEKANYNIDTEI